MGPLRNKYPICRSKSLFSKVLMKFRVAIVGYKMDVQHKQKVILNEWQSRIVVGKSTGSQALLVALYLHQKLPKKILMNEDDAVVGSDKMTNSMILRNINASDISNGIRVPFFFTGAQFNRGKPCNLQEYKLFLDRIIANQGLVRIYHQQFGSKGDLNTNNIKDKSLQILYSEINMGEPTNALTSVAYFLERKFIILKQLKHKRMILLGYDGFLN